MEQKRHHGIDAYPKFVVEDYWRNYGGELNTDLDSFKNTVLQTGSKQLIDDMSDRLYKEIYEKQGISREEWDEESDYNDWEKEMPGSISNWARGVGEFLTDVGAGVLDVTASVVSGAKTDTESWKKWKTPPSAASKENIDKAAKSLAEAAKKVGQADLGYQKPYQIDDLDSLINEFTEGSIGTALAFALHEGSRTMVPIMLGRLVSAKATLGTLAGFYTGNTSRERQDIIDELNGMETEVVPLGRTLAMAPVGMTLAALDSFGAAAAMNAGKLGKDIAKATLTQNSNLYKNLAKVSTRMQNNAALAVTGHVTIGALGEGATEATQSGIEYIAPRVGVDGSKVEINKMWEHAAFGGIIGAIAGGGMSAVTGTAHEAVKKPTVDTKEEDEKERKGDEPIAQKPVELPEMIQDLKAALEREGIDPQKIDEVLNDEGLINAVNEELENIINTEDGKTDTEGLEKAAEALTTIGVLQQRILGNEVDAVTEKQIKDSVLSVLEDAELAKGIINEEIQDEMADEREQTPPIVSDEAIRMARVLAGQHQTRLETDKPTADTDGAAALIMEKQAENPEHSRRRIDYGELGDMTNLMVAPRGVKTPFHAILTKTPEGTLKVHPIGDSKAVSDENPNLIIDPTDAESPRLYNVTEEEVTPEMNQFVDDVISKTERMVRNKDSDVAQKDFLKLQNDKLFKQLPQEIKDKWKDFEIALEKKKLAEQEAEKKAKEDEAKAKEEAKQKEKAAAEKQKAEEAAPKAAEKETKAQPEAKETKEKRRHPKRRSRSRKR